MIKEFDIEISSENDIRIFDFIDTDDFFNWSYNSFNGDLKFVPLPIKHFKSSSNLIKFLKKYSVENNLDINKYDIVYQKNKEWYSKLFFNLL